MKKIFVDSNVFLRFFTLDDGGQHDMAANLFHKAAFGKVTLVTGPPVLFEIAWTLRSTYRLSKDQVLDVLSAITALKGLNLTDSYLVGEAITNARKSGQEFTDAYIYTQAIEVEADEIASFNRKHFEKLEAELHVFI